MQPEKGSVDSNFSWRPTWFVGVKRTFNTRRLYCKWRWCHSCK